MPSDSSNYLIVSTDTHAGASIRGYRDYLDEEWLEPFDEWTKGFKSAWKVVEAASRGTGLPDNSINWDSSARLAALETQGVVAEVIYPNTIPPFFSSNNLTVPAPVTKEEYRRRLAGTRAHNRWLAEFCADTPGRRGGLVQVCLNDVDDALADVKWGKDNGMCGVLIPGVPPGHPSMAPLWSEEYEPLWTLCEDLGMPVSQHAGSGNPAIDARDAAGRAITLLEVMFYSHRTLWHLIWGGVFERHPDLKFVFAEEGGAWVPATLQSLERSYDHFRTPGTTSSGFGGEATMKLSLRPREYWSRNCYLASFFNRHEMAARHDIGLRNLMWATDFPHDESTYPYSAEAIRWTMSDIPEPEVRQMLGLTAVDVFNFDTEFLAGLADRIGLSPEAMRVPLDELPGDVRTCPAFDETHPQLV